MTPLFNLQIPDIRLTPDLQRDPDGWSRVQRRITGRPYLNSDGLATVLGPPQLIDGKLLERCREVVARFDAFYGKVIEEYYRSPARRPEYLSNPMFDAAIEADRATPMPLPLSRLDCVLTQDGELRVIEINAVGVSTVHLRAVTYLSRALGREGLNQDAEHVYSLYRLMTQAFQRHYLSQRPARPRSDPTIGIFTLPRMLRSVRVALRPAFKELGWGYVEGRPADLEILPGQMRLRGTPIDILWGDIVFYLGFQFQRYVQTQFATKFDFVGAPEATAAVLQNPLALELFKRRDVINISPVKSYLALSKHLLSWIHRADRFLGDEDRRWLSDHVARTYSSEERRGGVLSVADATSRREGLLLKPCQSGGAHGVVIGRETPPDEWSKRMEEIWSDPNWVLQDFYRPRRLPNGESLSVGLYNYGGQLGGITLRSASSLVISARRSTFIPVAATPT